MRENNFENIIVTLFGQRHSTFYPCTQTTPTSLRGLTYLFTILQEVKQFDYRGLRLDSMVNMKAAVSSIQEKSNKAHSLVLAVSYSLRYDNHHSNPTICSSPVEMLNLWKSCVLPHFLLYLRYISDETQLKTLQASLNKSLSTTMHGYGHPTALLYRCLETNEHTQATI